MLVLVTGTPGAGKSYYAVRKMLDAVEGGRYVASNVALVDGWAESFARSHPLRWAMPGRRRQLAARWRERTYVSADLDELFRVRKRPGSCCGSTVVSVMPTPGGPWRSPSRATTTAFSTAARKAQ